MNLNFVERDISATICFSDYNPKGSTGISTLESWRRHVTVLSTMRRLHRSYPEFTGLRANGRDPNQTSDQPRSFLGLRSQVIF